MHGLSFVGSVLHCNVRCDAKVQLKFQPNMHLCRVLPPIGVSMVHDDAPVYTASFLWGEEGEWGGNNGFG